MGHVTYIQIRNVHKIVFRKLMQKDHHSEDLRVDGR